MRGKSILPSLAMISSQVNVTFNLFSNIRYRIDDRNQVMKGACTLSSQLR